MTGGMSVAAMEWLEGRRLDVELCDRLGVGSKIVRRPASAGGSFEAITYPFKREGVVISTKHRALIERDDGPRFWWGKDELHIVFNEDCLRDPTLVGLGLIITEGQDDCIAALQAGFAKTISVPDGAPENPIEDATSSAKYAWVEGISALLKAERVPYIILAVDGDQAGAALMHDLSIHHLGRARCKYVTYPLARDPEKRGRDRLKDLNEVLEDYGEVGVQAVIARAQFLKVNGVYKMSELPPLADRPVYRVPGLEAFDEHFRMRLGDVSAWTGVPGHGKTTFLNDIINRIVTEAQIRAAWASFEQEPQVDHRRSLRAWHGGDYEFRLTWQQRKAADEWIEEHHRFMVPDEDDDPTLEWLLDRLEAAVIQHECKILVVDPWNEAVHVRSAGENETDYTNRTLRTLRRFARKFCVHLAIVAHPTKMQRRDDGTYPMPSMYDVSGSAAWFNKPEQGVIVHRSGPEETLVKVQKSKFTELLGSPGITAFNYNKQTRRYIETERNIPDEEPKRRRRG